MEFGPWCHLNPPHLSGRQNARGIPPFERGLTCPDSLGSAGRLGALFRVRGAFDVGRMLLDVDTLQAV